MTTASRDRREQARAGGADRLVARLPGFIVSQCSQQREVQVSGGVAPVARSAACSGAPTSGSQPASLHCQQYAPVDGFGTRCGTGRLRNGVIGEGECATHAGTEARGCVCFASLKQQAQLGVVASLGFQSWRLAQARVSRTSRSGSPARIPSECGREVDDNVGELASLPRQPSKTRVVSRPSEIGQRGGDEATYREH